LFRDATKNRVLLNVGGIANLTYLRAGGAMEDVIAFDTGPGNCISDELCRRHDPAGPGFDRDGAVALSGKVNFAVVQRCLQNEFFHRWPPKSTDGPAMIANFDEAIALESASLIFPDQLATAIELTARSINAALPPDSDIFISGGGCLNQRLMQRLADAGLVVRPIANAGMELDPSAKEAIAFAILGAATLDGVPSNVPSVTGAKRKVILGSITPRP
jgi:anhydro-N-acetylmuramic acid kinase